MNRILLAAAAASASLIFGCAAPEGDDETASAASEVSVRTQKPVCRLDRSVTGKTTRLPLYTEEHMQGLVDDANEAAGTDLYTLESFGPYGHVDIVLHGAPDRDVEATVRLRHMLPKETPIPEQTIWKGVVPRGVSGPLELELYFDPVKYGEDVRFGKNTGVVEVECEGTRSTSTYVFAR